MTNRKYSIYELLIILCIFICMIIVDIYKGKKFNTIPENKTQLEKTIKDFKKNITKEELELFIFENIENCNSILNLKLDKFSSALKESKIGGYSHPVFFKRFKLVENKDGQHIEINIKAGKENHTDYLTVSICIVEKGNALAGFTYRSEDLICWAYEIGLLEAN